MVIGNGGIDEHEEHEATTPVEAMDLVGGDPSLDLVNTASARRDGRLKEKLRTYDDLVTWAERVELLTPVEGRALRREAAAHPSRAASVLERARALRETIYRVFSSDAAAAADVESLGEAAAEGASHRRLEASDGGYVFAWPASHDLERILWPVALSAAQLLTSDRRARVKECAADSCSWLFLDMSRNRSRRWCDMKDCGNRAKARRYQARKRKG